MADSANAGVSALEITFPDGARRQIPVTESKFYIGRGVADNHLAIPDDRVSRQCAVIVYNLLKDG